MNRDGRPRESRLPFIRLLQHEQAGEIGLRRHERPIDVRTAHVNLLGLVSLANETVVALAQELAQLKVLLHAQAGQLAVAILPLALIVMVGRVGADGTAITVTKEDVHMNEFTRGRTCDSVADEN